MSDYTKTTNFGAKDALSSGDSNKLLKGSEFDTEFDAIETAIATKVNNTGAGTIAGNKTISGANTHSGNNTFSGDNTYTGDNDFSGATVTPPAGFVVQAVNTQDGAVATGTTVLPIDDTIPQNTEGDEYMTLAITPLSATNKLKIDVVVKLAHSSTATVLGAALFQDSTAGALAAGTGPKDGAAGQSSSISFTHWMTAGTTSATTFKVRAGANGAGTTTFNGSSGSRLFGGVMASSITITEIQQ